MLTARHVVRVVRQTVLKCGGGFSSLRLESLPEAVVNCRFPIRGGPLQNQVRDLERRIQQPEARDEWGDPFSFKDLIHCDLANVQVRGHEPLRFHRQVLACLAEPSLLSENLYADDVRERARRYLAGVQDSRLGAYSHSKGHLVFRKEVADFLSARDGVETDPEHVFLTDGVSAAVHAVLQLMISSPQDGVLLPLPQYPLYSASLSLLTGTPVGYFLNEADGWDIDIQELERSLSEFQARGGTARAMVVINPGNPSGQILSRKRITDVLKFAEKHQLAILVDEVYQDVVLVDDKRFVPLRKIAVELGSSVEVFSFSSASAFGEGGLRAGFVHCGNLDAQVLEQMYKLVSISLCSNTLGQALMASILTPPPLSGPSRAAHDTALAEWRARLRRSAERVTERLNGVAGITCQRTEAGLYAYPRIIVKGYVMKKAISFATVADQIYCQELLERTGILAVPGSAFGQKPGHFHVRLPLLTDEDLLEEVLDRFAAFHLEHPGGWFR